MLRPCWTHIGHQHPETHVPTYQTHHVACPFLIIIFWGHFTDTCFLCLEVKKNKNTATYTFVPYIYNCPKFIFIYIANTNIKKKKSFVISPTCLYFNFSKLSCLCPYPHPCFLDCHCIYCFHCLCSLDSSFKTCWPI